MDNAPSSLRKFPIQETKERIELSNLICILIVSSDFRSLMGFTAVAGIVDEVAFLLDEGSRPDFEVLRALRPALATTGGPLICVSSPYAKRGALYTTWKHHFGKDGDPVLVWQAPSLTMNPTLAAEAIARAREGGFYSGFTPKPATDRCSACGRPIYSFQRDGKCLRCVYRITEDKPRQAAVGPF